MNYGTAVLHSVDDDNQDRSRLMRLALRCFERRRIWFGTIRGLMGIFRRSFVIRSQGDMEGDTLVFRESMRFDHKTARRRVWRIREREDGLHIESDGVRMIRPGREREGTLAFVYTVEIGGIEFVYDDRYRLLPGDGVENTGRANLFGIPVMTVHIRSGYSAS